MTQHAIQKRLNPAYLSFLNSIHIFGNIIAVLYVTHLVYSAGDVFIVGSLITEKCPEATRAHIGLLERDRAQG